MTLELNQRDQSILRFVVERYIESGEPVGSETVKAAGVVDVSSATIRNILKRLESDGYLTQPHTSAGRIPTPIAMRSHVNWVREQASQLFSPAEWQESDGSPAATSSYLSDMSSLTGLVFGPKLSAETLREIRLVFVHERRILAVMVTTGGLVYERLTTLDGGIAREDLETVQSFLNTIVEGKTLTDLREEVHRQLSETRSQYRKIVEQAAVISDELRSPILPELHLDGASNLVDTTDFGRDLDRLAEILRLLESKERMAEVLDQIHTSKTPLVFVGPELESNVDSDLGPDLGLVVCGFFRGEDPAGLVGVLGPVRMNYGRMIPLVDYAARMLSINADPTTE